METKEGVSVAPRVPLNKKLSARKNKEQLHILQQCNVLEEKVRLKGQQVQKEEKEHRKLYSEKLKS